MTSKKGSVFAVAIIAVLVLLASLVFNMSVAADQQVVGLVGFSELGWSGTTASSADEYIELVGADAFPVNTEGWHVDIYKEGGLTSTIMLPPAIVEVNGYVLFERTDGTTTSAQEDGIYSGSLPNTGVMSITLVAWDGQVQDTIVLSDTQWPAGLTNPRTSMAYNHQKDMWEHSPPSQTVVDADGNVLFGSPGYANPQPSTDEICDLVPFVKWDYTLTFEITPTIKVDMVLGDGTDSGAEYEWYDDGWNFTVFWFEPSALPSCIDAAEFLSDGIENGLMERPSSFILPADIRGFVDAVLSFQESKVELPTPPPPTIIPPTPTPPVPPTLTPPPVPTVEPTPDAQAWCIALPVVVGQ